MSCQVFTATTSGGFAQPSSIRDSGAAIAQNSWGYTSVGVSNSSVLNAIDYSKRNGGAQSFRGHHDFLRREITMLRGKWYPGCYSGVVAVAARTIMTCARIIRITNMVRPSRAGWRNDFGHRSRGVFSTYTSTPDTLYGFLQGTSMACPHVSGVAALVLRMFPENCPLRN